MVTVREQLPGRLNELSEETTVEHAEQARQDLAEWLDRVRGIYDGAALEQLERVANYTLKKELETDVSHPSHTLYTGIEMANILAHLHVDEDTLSAAMLYRSVRENVMQLDEVREEFGEAVYGLIKGTLSMGKLSELIEKNKRLEDHFNNNQREHLTGIYKMLISMTEDVRVVLIKLAERTYSLRELATASKERQERVAREILTIYSPLAHRLGIAQLKWELEDLAFRYLAPDRYKEIATLLNEKRLERENYIQNVIEQLRTELGNNGIHAEISGRVKHIYSIYRKMKSKNLSFDQLYDIRAVRVLVKTIPECYHSLGIVHQLWRHIPHQFDDYITNPKANGYRSLHTAVIAENKSLEVQIRTLDMHEEAELGYVHTLIIKKVLKPQTIRLIIVYILCVLFWSIIRNVTMPAHIKKMMILKILNKSKSLKILRKFMCSAVMVILKNCHVAQRCWTLLIMCIPKSAINAMPHGSISAMCRSPIL